MIASATCPANAYFPPARALLPQMPQSSGSSQPISTCSRVPCPRVPAKLSLDSRVTPCPSDPGGPRLHPVENSPEECGEISLDFVILMTCSGALSANNACVLCRWAGKAGAQRTVSEYGFWPSASTGHYATASPQIYSRPCAPRARASRKRGGRSGTPTRPNCDNPITCV